MEVAEFDGYVWTQIVAALGAVGLLVSRQREMRLLGAGYRHADWPRWSGDPGGSAWLLPLLAVLALPVVVLFLAFLLS